MRIRESDYFVDLFSKKGFDFGVRKKECYILKVAFWHIPTDLCSLEPQTHHLVFLPCSLCSFARETPPAAGAQ